MSTMTQIEELTESPRSLSPVVAKPIPKNAEQSKGTHPLVVVFIAAFIAFNLSVGMIGSIVIWLSLRHSGVMAP
jgi:hypothetical protein